MNRYMTALGMMAILCIAMMGGAMACRPHTMVYPRPLDETAVFSDLADELNSYAVLREGLLTSGRGLDGTWRRSVEGVLYSGVLLERKVLKALSVSRQREGSLAISSRGVADTLGALHPDGRRVATEMLEREDVSELLRSLLHTLRKERTRYFELSCTLYEKESKLSGAPLPSGAYGRMLAFGLASARYGTPAFRFIPAPPGGVPPQTTAPPLYPGNPFATDDEDIDDDGLPDRKERGLGTDPCRQDSDGDGIRDADELTLGYDPLSPDSDGDGTNDLADPFPLDPSRGACGVDFNDDEEVLMLVYGTIAVTATIGTMFGCSSCAGIAIKATKEFIAVYQEEMREREQGTDE